MSLSTSEIESLRHALGYGNVSINGLPYTADGWWEIFQSIVSPYLGTGVETASTTAATAGAVTTITVTALGSIVAYDQIVVDVGPNAETVTVQAIAGSTLTAYFTKAHSASGYPVATMSGKARLRLLLWDADQAWRAITDASVGRTAGIQSVDKNDVVFFGNGTAVMSGKLAHYKSIVEQISQLVRVPHVWPWASGGCRTVEAY